MTTIEKTELEISQELGFKTLGEYYDWCKNRDKWLRGQKLHRAAEYDRECIELFLNSTKEEYSLSARYRLNSKQENQND